MSSNFLRTRDDRSKPRTPKFPEQALYDRLTAVVVDPQVVRDADQAQAFLKAQAEVKPRAMVESA